MWSVRHSNDGLYSVHHNPPDANRQSAANKPQAVESNKCYSAFQPQCYRTVRPSIANFKKIIVKNRDPRADRLSARKDSWLLYLYARICTTCWSLTTHSTNAKSACNATFEHTDNILPSAKYRAWRGTCGRRIASHRRTWSTAHSQYLVAAYHDRIARRSALFARRVLIVTTAIIYCIYIFIYTLGAQLNVGLLFAVLWTARSSRDLTQKYRTGVCVFTRARHVFCSRFYFDHDIKRCLLLFGWWHYWVINFNELS